jgi:DNA primase
VLPVSEQTPANVARADPAPLSELDRRLRAISAAEYVLALTGRRPNRQGKVLCPLHQERHPSLHLYRDGTFYCYGCCRGGSIIDFAAALWGCGTRGVEFLALRARLARQFGLAEDV